MKELWPSRNRVHGRYSAMLNPVRGINRLLAETGAGNARLSRRSSARFPGLARNFLDSNGETIEDKKSCPVTYVGPHYSIPFILCIKLIELKVEALKF